MGQPLSMDLRSRVLAAIDDGMNCRSAAARFGVAPSTAIRWHGQRRDTGSFTPKPQRSQRVEERRDDILAIWNARSHKRPAVREAIEAAGATVLFLPPYSPDFNPIEKAFAKLKALLRREAERTVSGLWSLI